MCVFCNYYCCPAHAFTFAGDEFWDVCIYRASLPDESGMIVSSPSQLARNLGVGRAICSECLAGRRGYSFSDSSLDPSWVETEGLEEPWDEEPAIFCIMPFTYTRKERLLRRDIFHSTKLGFFRSLFTSSLLLVGSLGFFGTTSVKGILETSWNHCALWKAASGKYANVRVFTKSNTGYSRLNVFPSGNYKGHDTMVLLEWLLFFVRSGPLRSAVGESLSVLQVVERALHNALEFTKGLYKARDGNAAMWITVENMGNLKLIWSGGLMEAFWTRCLCVFNLVILRPTSM